MTPTPLWLQSSELQQILQRLVDALDAAEGRGSAKARSVGLNSRTWPALYDAPLESSKEYLWHCARQMHQWGWISVTPAGALCEAGYAMEPRVSVLDVASIRAAVGRPERIKSAAELWRSAVKTQLRAPDEVKAFVSQFLIEIPGRSMVEIVERLNLLPELGDRTWLLREVSSHLFWGMSKVLDSRQELVAALLGEGECPFPESPVQLLVLLPEETCDGVLFIENRMSYEKVAINARSMPKLALVYAAGFQASAHRLRAPGGASIFYSSKGELSREKREEFERWLFRRTDDSTKNALFWGDLDYSGMRILAALRTTFPGMAAWQPGYRPMIEALRVGGGHLPESAAKVGQRPVNMTGCQFADTELLPILRSTGHFLDQEIIELSFA